MLETKIKPVVGLKVNVQHLSCGWGLVSGTVTYVSDEIVIVRLDEPYKNGERYEIVKLPTDNFYAI